VAGGRFGVDRKIAQKFKARDPSKVNPGRNMKSEKMKNSASRSILALVAALSGDILNKVER
jgi:hypothetical protein